MIERAVILEEEDRIRMESLPERIALGKRALGAITPTALPNDLAALRAAGTLEDIERGYLMKVLEDTGWQKKKASTILGINSSTLYRKIQRYGLEPKTSNLGADDDEDEEGNH